MQAKRTGTDRASVGIRDPFRGQEKAVERIWCARGIERARDPEAIGLGRRNAPVGCPPGAASIQLAMEIRSGRRSSGCLGTDGALAQGRDELQRKVIGERSRRGQPHSPAGQIGSARRIWAKKSLQVRVASAGGVGSTHVRRGDGASTRWRAGPARETRATGATRSRRCAGCPRVPGARAVCSVCPGCRREIHRR